MKYRLAWADVERHVERHVERPVAGRVAAFA
jgi:hypothetical protein